MNGEFIFNLIQTIAFVIPVSALIWNMAKMHSRVEHVEASTKRAHERLDKYVDKMEAKIEEMSAQIQSIIVTQGRIEEKLNQFIKGDK